jgi:hypothetical protein
MRDKTHAKPEPARLVIDRREFTAAAVMALLSGVAITVSGCGGGGGGSSPSGPSGGATPPATGDRVGNVSANHGHQAVLRAAQITAANAVTLDIRGSADHPHSLELSADEVRAVGNGQRVSKSSSVDDAHSHTVTFN